MRELKIVLGWFTQIVGMLLFPVTLIIAFTTGWTMIFISGFTPIMDMELIDKIKWLSPTLTTFTLAIFLTWLGLRIRRNA